MAYMPIYPMFHIGDKVKAGSYIAYSKCEKHFTKYDVTVTGIVMEIILKQSIVDGNLIYSYKLDDGKVYAETSIIQKL